MNISPQSQTLFKALLDSTHPLDAKQLANKLHIFPASVYRLVKPLIEMGLVTKINQYPDQFIAKPLDEALSLFLLYQNDWFKKQFSHSNQKTESVSLSFIQSRDELMNLSEKEINQATKSIDLLRSGPEIPADVMLAMIESKKRGVQTRMLIQDYSEENANQVDNWIKNGIQVRKTKLKQIRLMLYDSKILYFMSYKHVESKEDMGMKISYAPFAAILSQLFETWWQKAEII